MSTCPRVQQRIECPECEYPASEAQYSLTDSILGAVDWISNTPIEDPGHADCTHDQDCEVHMGDCSLQADEVLEVETPLDLFDVNFWRWVFYHEFN